VGDCGDGAGGAGEDASFGHDVCGDGYVAGNVVCGGVLEDALSTRGRARFAQSPLSIAEDAERGSERQRAGTISVPWDSFRRRKGWIRW